MCTVHSCPQCCTSRCSHFPSLSCWPPAHADTSLEEAGHLVSYRPLVPWWSLHISNCPSHTPELPFPSARQVWDGLLEKYACLDMCFVQRCAVTYHTP